MISFIDGTVANGFSASGYDIEEEDGLGVVFMNFYDLDDKVPFARKVYFNKIRFDQVRSIAWKQE